jgi:hypothetical protein
MDFGWTRLQTVGFYFARAVFNEYRLVPKFPTGQAQSSLGSAVTLSPIRTNNKLLALLTKRESGVPMTPLSIFGLFAVTAMLVCYALEARSRWFILAFAGACTLGSVYGFLQGAWPFGLVEAVWSVVALRRWVVASRSK